MTYIQPLLPGLLVILIAAVLWSRKSNNGVKLAFTAAVSLLLLSWPPVDWLISRPLEIWYPAQPFQPVSLQAIVVLSSAVQGPTPAAPYDVPDQDTYRRCESAAWLYKHVQQVPVLACGGVQTAGDRPVSTSMRVLLERAGVPPGMIWTEERSHSTHENALYGSQMLRRGAITRIALVTEAKSMLRAQACFRREGMTVFAAPCAFRELGAFSEELLPDWKAIRNNEIAFHELLGLAWYRLRGWI